MTYEEFLDFVPSKCMYETIYEDSNGYPTLVIRMLDAYSMVNKLQNKEWVGLTDEERNACLVEADPCEALLEHEAWQLMRDIEAKLKEKNT